MVAEHILQPVLQIGARSGNFGWKIRTRAPEIGEAHLQQRVGRKLGKINVGPQIAQRQSAETIFLEESHVLAEILRRGVDPRVR
jgi:hypothetical protein